MYIYRHKFCLLRQILIGGDLLIAWAFIKLAY